MKKILLYIANKIGVDKTIAYTSSARVLQGLTGVLSIFFISTFLTGTEQGFYYTFGSILALQVFFELGLTGIMIQYVAHEASHLQLTEHYYYVGEDKYKSRLASLVHFCIKWYSALAFIVFLFLLIVGFIYFAKYGDDNFEVSWKMPWVLICIGTAVKILQSPLSSIYFGLGYVKDMSKIEFWQQIAIPSVTWIGLASGFKLYVLGIGYVLSVLLWFAYVWKTQLYIILKNLWESEINEKVYYFKEIFPYQWRIAISWISGYFIYQLFTPVLFASSGAVVAGQMGMTLQAINAIQAFSFSWMKTKVPFMSQLIAKREYQFLDILFNRTTKQLLLVCFCLLVLFGVLLEMSFIIDAFPFTLLKERFISGIPLIVMLVSVIFNQLIGAMANYIRCHKREPLMWESIVVGLACLLGVPFFGSKFGVLGVTIVYSFIICCVSCPWVYIIFKKKKVEWHGK